VPAIRFDDVAVKPDGAFADTIHVDGGSKRSPDEALDFQSAARTLAC
jgi:hypothetical protein